MIAPYHQIPAKSTPIRLRKEKERGIMFEPALILIIVGAVFIIIAYKLTKENDS